MNHLICLGQTLDRPIDIFTFDDQLQQKDHATLASLDEYDNLDQAKHAVVLLPGQWLRLLPVDLPKMSASELREAIPYALEDQVADDVDEQLFFKGEPKLSGKFSVTVINQQQFLQTFEQLKQYNISAMAMLPDSLALRWKPERWSLAFIGQSVLWRYGEQLAVSFDRDQFAFCWPKILHQYHDTLPKQMDVFGDKEADGASLSSTQDITLCWHDAAEWLSPKLFAPHAMNMLQGKYRLHARLSKIKRRWLQCGAVTVVALLLVLLTNVSGYFVMRHYNVSILAQIKQLMTVAGVDASQGPSQAKSLIQGELLHYQRLQKQNQWMGLMDKIGPVVHQDSQWQMQAVDYSKGRMTLTLQETGNASLQRLIAQLSQLGLNVKQLTARDSNNLVTLQIVEQESGHV